MNFLPRCDAFLLEGEYLFYREATVCTFLLGLLGGQSRPVFLITQWFLGALSPLILFLRLG